MKFGYPLKRSLLIRVASAVRAAWSLLFMPLPIGRPAPDPAREALLARLRVEQQREQSLVRMRDDLGRLLRQHPKSHAVFPQLSKLESVLNEGDLVGLDDLAPQVLADALGDMERLVKDWSPLGLAELRSRVAVLVRKEAAARALQTAPLKKPDSSAARKNSTTTMEECSNGPEISEVEHEDFEETERSWRGIAPPNVTNPSG